MKNLVIPKTAKLINRNPLVALKNSMQRYGFRQYESILLANVNTELVLYGISFITVGGIRIPVQTMLGKF